MFISGSAVRDDIGSSSGLTGWLDSDAPVKRSFRGDRIPHRKYACNGATIFKEGVGNGNTPIPMGMSDFACGGSCATFELNFRPLVEVPSALSA